MLVLHWVCIIVTSWDHKKREQSPKVFNIIIWIIPVIFNFVTVAMHLHACGISDNLHIVLFSLIGVLFILIGNYMPKTRQNRTIGIKIKWTLESEKNWTATHRIAGFVWTVCGIIIIPISFLPEKLMIPIFISLVALSCLIPTLYSYRYHKKELENGEISVNKGVSKTKSTVLILLPIVILALAITLCFTGSVEVTLSENMLLIDSEYYSELSVDYSDIEEVTLVTDADFGRRVYGFGTPRLSMGSFRNDAYGSYTLYAYTSNKTAIEIKLHDRIIVVNAKDHNKTVKLFDMIREKI